MEVLLIIGGIVAIVYIIKFIEMGFEAYSADRFDNFIRKAQEEHAADLAAREAALTPEEKNNREARKRFREKIYALQEKARKDIKITEARQNAEKAARKAAELAAIPSWEWTPKPKRSMIFKADVDAYYSSPEWKAKRIIMLARAKNTCNRCHVVQSSGLHVHHNTYENFGNEKMSDLEVLCEPCHEKHHKKKFYYN